MSGTIQVPTSPDFSTGNDCRLVIIFDARARRVDVSIN